METTISLCMIVKNEELVLDRCLNSVNNYIDEIIIVDTGSTDKTISIAEKYTRNIFKYEWDNDFSKARNFSIEKATSDWVLILDADEFVDENNLKKLKKSLNTIKDDCNVYSVKIVNFLGHIGEQIIEHHSERLYKNHQNIYFDRLIHEQLTSYENKIIRGNSELIVYHSGYLNKVHRSKNKSKRNQNLLSQELLNSSNKSFDYFNLGNEYNNKADYNEALKYYVMAFKEKKDIRLNWVGVCLVQMISCLIKLNRLNDALIVIEDAEKLWENNVELFGLKAQIYYMQSRYVESKIVLKEILSIREDKKKYILTPYYKDFIPNKLLGTIYFQENNYKKAIHHLILAYNIFQKDQYLNYLIQSILILDSNEIECNNIYKLLLKMNIIQSEKDEISFFINLLEKKSVVNVSELLKNSLNFSGKDKFLNLYEKNKFYNVDEEDCEVIKSHYFKKHISLNEVIYLDIMHKTDKFTNTIKEKLDQKGKRYLDFVKNNSDQMSYFFDEILNLIQINIVRNNYEALSSQDFFKNVIKDDSFKESIANIFFANKNYDLAIHFFNNLNSLKLKEQSFNNLIEIFIEHDMKDLAFDLLKERIFENQETSYTILKKGILLSKIKNVTDVELNILSIARKNYINCNEINSISVKN